MKRDDTSVPSHEERTTPAVSEDDLWELIKLPVSDRLPPTQREAVYRAFKALKETSPHDASN